MSLFYLAFSTLSCTQPRAVSVPEPVPAPASEELEKGEDIAKPSEELPAVVILSDVGFSTPESVYYDRKRDLYLVSNINGSPHEKDGNGFISRVTPEGEVTLKFIDGASDKISLDAPKGLTISGDTLYVADIDRVRIFDALTGEAKGEIEVPGATFVNDLATGSAGIVYVSDSGLNKEWESSGTDAIYVIKEGKLKPLIASKKSLGSPNGLLAGKGGVWVVSRTGELYWISDKGKLEQRQKVSEGSNDGIVMTSDGRFLISSWAEKAVLAGKPGSEFHPEMSGLEAPADIGFDCQRERVLIPLFKNNTVILHTLSAPSTPELVKKQEAQATPPPPSASPE